MCIKIRLSVEAKDKLLSTYLYNCTIVKNLTHVSLIQNPFMKYSQSGYWQVMMQRFYSWKRIFCTSSFRQRNKGRALLNGFESFLVFKRAATSWKQTCRGEDHVKYSVMDSLDVIRSYRAELINLLKRGSSGCQKHAKWDYNHYMQCQCMYQTQKRPLSCQYLFSALNLISCLVVFSCCTSRCRNTKISNGRIYIRRTIINRMLWK